MGDGFVKVIPSPEELLVVGLQNHGWKCQETGCSYVAENTSILGLHRSQCHNFRTKHRRGAENTHYHCPVADCYFGPQSERYFKNIDILRAHYMKIHSEKKFTCSKCRKTFGLERDCHRHETECGQDFPCVDCGKVYTNKSALRRHCDCYRHRFPTQEKKVKSVKEPKSKPARILNKTKPPTATARNTLPKQILPKNSSQTQSLHIQTDSSGCLLFISKLTSEISISQAVQTIDRSSMTKSTAIQTTLECSPGHIMTPNQSKRLSTGIQTGWPSIGSLNVAQTQTGDSILQKAMKKASIPILNVSKGTQKSPSGYKRKKQQTASCTAGSQTFYSVTAVKRSRSEIPGSNCEVLQQTAVTPDGIAQSMAGQNIDFMSTMSTQTHLSCVSEQFPKLYNMESGIQLQDCHTQTHSHPPSCDQATSFYLDQTLIPRSFIPSSDQVTQTKSDYFSNDQDTQTGNINSVYFNYTSLPFASIQDGQTQTALVSALIYSGHNQTALAAITNVSQVQDQGTTCEGLLEPDGRGVEAEELNLENDSFLSAQQCPEKSLRTSELSNDLAGFLLDVMTGDVSPEESRHLQQMTSAGNDLCENAQNTVDNLCLSPISMETQTLGNLGMDSMTQTVDEFGWNMSTQTANFLGWDMSTQTADFLGWDMGTQTANYLLTDMMTQTGDDLLEFLTNDTHTQTLDDSCMNLLPDDSSKIPSYARTSTSDAMTEVCLDDLFEDHASTQTVWDSEDQMFDLHGSSFSLDASYGNSGQVVGGHPDLYLMKEHTSNQTGFSDSQGRKWGNGSPSEAHMTSSDLGRETETAETQTAYDPVFDNLQNEDLMPLNLNKTVKYLESSHTQTSQDPMLPSVCMDDDPMPFFKGGLETETSETQTRTDYTCRETAECQTPWDSDWISLGTAETQTQTRMDYGGRETAECQTPWNSDWTAVGTAETHTQTRTEYGGRETAECQTPWDSDWNSIGTVETQTQTRTDYTCRETAECQTQWDSDWNSIGDSGSTNLN